MPYPSLVGQGVVLFPRQEKQGRPWLSETGGRAACLLGSLLCVCACTLSVYALDKGNLDILNFILLFASVFFW